MRILIIYMQKNCHTLREVIRVLKKYKRNYKSINRINLKRKHIKNFNLIITVGGDGTFLRTSHHLYCSIPILAVNANPKRKEGFFTRANRNNFEKKFLKLLKGKAKLKHLPRLSAIINKKQIKDLAVNEIFIGHHKPYRVSSLTINNSFYKCSGLLASTGAGSNAWIHSAGGKKMPLNSKKIQYLIRDHYKGNIYKAKKRKGFVNDEIIIKTENNGIMLVVDSLSQEYHLKKGSIIKIKKSSCSLTFIDI